MQIQQHAAVGFDGQLAHVDAEPGEHLLQPVGGVTASREKRLDLRRHEADIGQNGVTHRRELRGSRPNLQRLRPVLMKWEDHLLQILERHHGLFLLLRASPETVVREKPMAR